MVNLLASLLLVAVPQSFEPIIAVSAPSVQELTPREVAQFRSLDESARKKWANERGFLLLPLNSGTALADIRGLGLTQIEVRHWLAEGLVSGKRNGLLNEAGIVGLEFQKRVAMSYSSRSKYLMNVSIPYSLSPSLSIVVSDYDGLERSLDLTAELHGSSPILTKPVPNVNGQPPEMVGQIKSWFDNPPEVKVETIISLPASWGKDQAKYHAQLTEEAAVAIRKHVAQREDDLQKMARQIVSKLSPEYASIYRMMKSSNFHHIDAFGGKETALLKESLAMKNDLRDPSKLGVRSARLTGTLTVGLALDDKGTVMHLPFRIPFNLRLD
jgi:hypothetical protein